MNKIIISTALNFIILSGLFIISMGISSCGNDNYVPKPRGHFRIDLPEKKFIDFDSSFPYAFEHPVYSVINPYKTGNPEPYWINIDFPVFGARINISYKKVHNNLDTLLQDADLLAHKHIPKANDIKYEPVKIDSAKVYGLIYEITGTGVASPFQFYLTDSIDNYLRGALYFNVAPNNDSLSPVIDFIKEDILHMINTFRWKRPND